MFFATIRAHPVSGLQPGELRGLCVPGRCPGLGCVRLSAFFIGGFTEKNQHNLDINIQRQRVFPPAGQASHPAKHCFATIPTLMKDLIQLKTNNFQMFDSKLIAIKKA